jgi:hypothetical protein
MASEATVGGVSYLVAFVADAADDAHAACLREVARSVPDAGFFDGGSPRTVGVYVRAVAFDEPGAQALLGAVRGASSSLGVRFEVQLAERVVGEVAGDEFLAVEES